MKRSKNFIKQGFALIYALMIIALVSITIAAMGKFLTVDYQQTRKAVGITGAYQMAQSAIEDGIANYRAENRDHCNGQEISRGPFTTASGEGGYLVRICDGAPPDKYIMGIGTETVNNIRSVVVLRADLDSDGNVTNIYQTGF